nr:hypothetical protein [Anaerolineae bacterium]
MCDSTTRYFNLTFVFDAEKGREAFVQDMLRSRQCDEFEYERVGDRALILQSVIALFDAFDNIVADHAQCILDTTYKGQFEEDLLFFQIAEGVLYWADPVPDAYHPFRKEAVHAD